MAVRPGELFWLARRIESKQFTLPLSLLLPTPPPKREYIAVSAVADEVWQHRTGGNLTIFDKDHRSRTAEVLAAKHRGSLRLPCTAGGSQAKLNVSKPAEGMHMAVLDLPYLRIQP